MSERECKSRTVREDFKTIWKRKKQTAQQKTGQKTEFNFTEDIKCPTSIWKCAQHPQSSEKWKLRYSSVPHQKLKMGKYNCGQEGAATGTLMKCGAGVLYWDTGVSAVFGNLFSGIYYNRIMHSLWHSHSSCTYITNQFGTNIDQKRYV